MPTSPGTALGTSLASALGNSGGPIDPMIALLALAAGRPVFTEREYTVVAGTVVDIFDLSDATRTHVLTQADPAKQVAPPAMHADYTRPCYTLTGAEWYVSNRAAAYWSFRHDCLSAEEYAVFTRTAAAGVLGLHDTQGASTLNGTYFYVNAGTGAWRLTVANTAGNVIVNENGAVGQNVPTYLGFRLSGDGTTGGTTGEKYLKSAATAVTAVATPSAAAPAAPLTIGRRTVTNQTFVGRWPCSIFMPSLSAGQRAQFQAAIQALYGVAA